MASEDSKRERMKELARKLKAMADSAEEVGNDAEAKAFAVKMQKVMHQYSIDLSEIEYQDVRDEKIIQRIVRMSEVGHKDMKRKEVWTRDLALSLATHFFCRVHHYRSSNMLSFVGREEHVESLKCTLAAFIYLTFKLQRKAYHKIYWSVRPPQSHMSVEERRAILKGFKPSWRSGFSTGIAVALKEEIEKRKQVEDEGQYALIRLKDMMTTVDDYISENVTFSKRQSTSSVYTGNTVGWQQGYETGKQQIIGQKHIES